MSNVLKMHICRNANEEIVIKLKKKRLKFPMCTKRRGKRMLCKGGGSRERKQADEEREREKRKQGLKAPSVCEE